MFRVYCKIVPDVSSLPICFAKSAPPPDPASAERTLATSQFMPDSSALIAAAAHLVKALSSVAVSEAERLEFHCSIRLLPPAAVKTTNWDRVWAGMFGNALCGAFESRLTSSRMRDAESTTSRMMTVDPSKGCAGCSLRILIGATEAHLTITDRDCPRLTSAVESVFFPALQAFAISAQHPGSLDYGIEPRSTGAQREVVTALRLQEQ